MGRRKLSSFADFERALRNGYGVGEGCRYKPWLRVQDVPSHGRSSKIPGIKTGRIHHCLSTQEARFFYSAEFNVSVIDIREQFPLFPLDLVIRLADEAGIAYPCHPKTRAPIVMTTDFLLTLSRKGRRRFLAVAVKPSGELKNNRVLEKLEIERLWWNLLGVEWLLVTEKQLDEMLSVNIQWLSAPLRTPFFDVYQKFMRNSELAGLVSKLKPGSYEIFGLIEEFSTQLNIPEQSAGMLIRSLAWQHTLLLDLTQPIQEQGVLLIDNVNSQSLQQQEAIYGISA